MSIFLILEMSARRINLNVIYRFENMYTIFYSILHFKNQYISTFLSNLKI